MAVRLPNPPRRRRALWFAVGGVLVVAWAALVVAELAQVRRDTQSGIDKLESARDVLTPTGLVKGEGVDLLRDAQADFRRARNRVRSPLVAPLRILPVVGRQVRSVDALAGAATTVVDVGVEAVEDAGGLLDGSHPQGAERIALTRRLSEVAARSASRLARVDLGPGHALVGPIRDARLRFGEELGRLRDASRDMQDATEAFAGFLEGPRTYLVLAANNAEMRVGSGTFLSVGTLRVEGGQFSLSAMLPTEEFEVPDGAVPVEGDLADRWGFLKPNVDWRNLGSSPRFDTQAALAARMWEARGGGAIDGVLALDPVALQALLAATGPVSVEGVEIGPDNVVPEILLEQYRGLVGYPAEQERRDRLSGIARAAIDRLDSGDWDAVDLVDNLRRAGEGRHILAWSARPREQAGWEAAGLGGLLGDDSLLLGMHNRGGNKLDQFLKIRSRLTAEQTEGDETEVRVLVELRNEAPTGLPQYVAGPYPQAKGGAEGLYQGYVVAQLPRLARDLYVTDEAGKRMRLVAAGADGRGWVVAAYVDVPRGQSLTVVVHFRLPRGDRVLRVEPSAHVPVVEWSFGEDSWIDDHAQRVEW